MTEREMLTEMLKRVGHDVHEMLDGIADYSSGTEYYFDEEGNLVDII